MMIPFLNQGPVLFIAYVVEMFFLFLFRNLVESLPGIYLKPVGNREKKTTRGILKHQRWPRIPFSSKTSLCLGKVASTYERWKKSQTTSWDVLSTGDRRISEPSTVVLTIGLLPIPYY